MSHALISDEAAFGIRKYCNLSSDGSNDECVAALEEADKDTYYLDIYSIYAPLCHNSSLTAQPKLPYVN